MKNACISPSNRHLLVLVSYYCQHSSILIVVCLVSSVSPSVDLINLNCFILGDDINHIFEIQIPSTATVSALKKAIKEEKYHEFDTIDANRLELWQVSDLMPTVGCL